MPDTPALTLSADAGMVTKFSLADLGLSEDKVASIRIVDRPDFGHVSLDGDKGVNLVLSEAFNKTGHLDFKIEVTQTDGTLSSLVSNVTVGPVVQEAGWGLGQHYMLETGAGGRLVIEEGNEHRKVYVSGGDAALSTADIAHREGISADQVTGKWLEAHPEYGSSPETTLDSATGMKLWYQMGLSGDRIASNWLLFERGHEYEDLGRLVQRGSQGESELAPIYIGAYGDGADPVLNTEVNMYQELSAHVVIEGLKIVDGVQSLGGRNFLVSDVSSNGMWNIQNVDGFTMRGVSITDVHHDDPVRGGDLWRGSLERIQGIFIAGSDDVLIEDSFFARNGWEQGYKYDMTGGHQPPTMYSHNVYMAANNTGLTFRDNITMQGASFGAQLRPGGMVEDNLFLDNNFGFSVLNGKYDTEEPLGNFSLVSGNVITSGAHKTVGGYQGAVTVAMEVAKDSALIGNIIAHLEDPNNPVEMAQKTITHPVYYGGKKDFIHDDTIVYGWDAKNPEASAPGNQNIAGLDKGVLNATTIQHFTAELLGKSNATINDLGDYLRAQADGRLDGVVDADLINAYFRLGFGLSTDIRATETTLVFSPDDRADGVRWDNRLNWSTGDLPGTQDGDSADLAGNLVFYGTATQAIEDLGLGEAADFRVNAGKLTVAGDLTTKGDASRIMIDEAGQFFFAGYADTDALTINVAGGRMVNLGKVSGGLDISASDNGQAILASGGGSLVVTAGDVIEVTGTRAHVGFDGKDGGTAVLLMEDGAQLSLKADASGMGTIAEFRSGHFGASPNVTSGVVLDGTLTLDVAALSRTAATLVLLQADEILGSFDKVSVEGLSAKRDAVIHIDYTTDRVTLELGAEGAGQGRVVTQLQGVEDFQDGSAADTALWMAMHPGLVEGVTDLHGATLSYASAESGVQIAPLVQTLALNRMAVASVAGDPATYVAQSLGENGREQVFSNVGGIVGSRFADRISGNGRGEAIDGGAGDDMLSGEDGNDHLTGSSGRDSLHGGTGNDLIEGGTENDQLWGDAGNDIIRGDAGNDSLWGGLGADRLGGKEGDDRLFGGDGDDQIWGDDGNDSMTGNAGNDHLWGGNGQDTMAGGQGNDVLRGGAGADHFLFVASEAGRDTVTDFDAASGDVIEIARGTMFEWADSAAGLLLTSGDSSMLVESVHHYDDLVFAWV